ncbi:hypothetical protein HZC30_04535 [Candidatus Woesearchaeota archaeon]|nr:hypothetical protein [Candidatus Woesearchaeota archaeon]
MIIVIAFTVLGLGLGFVGFVKNIFSGFGGQQEKIFATVEADIKDKLSQSNEPLYYPQQTLNVDVKEEHVDGIGVKNTGDTSLNLKVIFQVRVGEDFQDFESGDQIQSFGSGETAFKAKMYWDNSVQKYSPTQAKPITFTLTAPDRFGNYLFKVKVVRDDGEEFASKTFFVRTS